MNEEQWIILDTETSGLYEPISVVEIAAQKMRGWERDGEPFQILLNHDVPIESQAEAVHGYSREFLRKHGANPIEAHRAFAEYAKDLPIVAYNLSFDWNRALAPEYQRLGIVGGGCRGFCAMTLARRTIKDAPNYKLETLKEMFSLSDEASHRGRQDVETLVRLWERHLAPNLYRAGLLGFSRISEFSRETPVARCLELLHGEGDAAWFYLDGGSNTHGPVKSSAIRELQKANLASYVFREGMLDWAPPEEIPEFAPIAEKQKRKPRAKKAVGRSIEDKEGGKGVSVTIGLDTISVSREDFSRWHDDTNEMIGICRGILADGKINNSEILALSRWLESSPSTQVYPFSAVAEQIEKILEDGVISEEELEDFRSFLLKCLSLPRQA